MYTVWDTTLYFLYCLNAHDMHIFVSHDTLVAKDEKVQVAAAQANGFWWQVWLAANSCI